MKPVIRQGVFETNSSSSHSLCIAVGELQDMCHLAQKVITAITGEFGWAVETHYDFDTKLAYLYTSAARGIKLPSDFDSSVLPEELYTDRIRMIERVVKNYTKCERVDFVVQKDNYYPFGYIDHQSVGVPNEAFESDKVMTNFLFNQHSFVHTDNDNY